MGMTAKGLSTVPFPQTWGQLSLRCHSGPVQQAGAFQAAALHLGVRIGARDWAEITH